MPLVNCIECHQKYMSHTNTPYCPNCAREYRLEQRRKKTILDAEAEYQQQLQQQRFASPLPFADFRSQSVASSHCEFCRGGFQEEEQLAILDICGHVYHHACLKMIITDTEAADARARQSGRFRDFQTLKCTNLKCERPFSRDSIKLLPQQH